MNDQIETLKKLIDFAGTVITTVGQIQDLCAKLNKELSKTLYEANDALNRL